MVLNGIASDWRRINSGVPQGSVLGPLLFLVYINDLTDNISSEMRLSSLCTRVEGITQTQDKLETDLQNVTNWAYQWKMVFNPDITNQAIEVIFSTKNKKAQHPELVCNGIPVSREENTQHFLDVRLNFSKHVREAVIKATKGISLLKCLSKYVYRKVFDLSYTLYVRPHLDYGDVMSHDQRSDLMNLIEQVQYKAALIVSWCWQGNSREKLYEELGWEALSERGWHRRLTMFYKIVNVLAPSYLFDHIPKQTTPNVSLRRNITRPPFSRKQRYDNSFFPFCINSWNTSDNSIKSLPSLQEFKRINSINSFALKATPSIATLRDKFGRKLLTKIKVTFSDLRDHRYNHNFNCRNPTCSCGLEGETSVHYLLCCPHANLRTTYIGKICEIIGSGVTVLPNDHLPNVYNDVTNENIIKEKILNIKQSGRFKKLEAFA